MFNFQVVLFGKYVEMLQKTYPQNSLIEFKFLFSRLKLFLSELLL